MAFKYSFPIHAFLQKKSQLAFVENTQRSDSEKNCHLTWLNFSTISKVYSLKIFAQYEQAELMFEQGLSIILRAPPRKYLHSEYYVKNSEIDEHCFHLKTTLMHFAIIGPTNPSTFLIRKRSTLRVGGWRHTKSKYDSDFLPKLNDATRRWFFRFPVIRRRCTWRK